MESKNRMRNLLLLFLLFTGLAFAAYWAKQKWKIFPPKPANELPEANALLSHLKLPPGFAIEIFAHNIDNARSMCLSPNHTLFVGNRDKDKVYALQDVDGDFKVDSQYTIYAGGHMPNGVAIKNGDLYVAEVNRILRFRNIESRLSNPGPPEVVFDKYPDKEHHGWKYIAFGPDGKLYVPVGAPCNICESEDPIFNTITRMNADGTGFEIVHNGIRNTVGFTWHPTTKELWFTDNGRDMMGDDVPQCELNHAPEDYMNFGYPYCHEGSIPDPEYGKKRSCSDFTPPAAKMGAHTAPLGICYYDGNQFPDDYKNAFYIARHGSWNRTIKSGYDVVKVSLNAQGQIVATEPFIEGWLSEDKKEVRGRPVDIKMYKDGSLLISDDHANCIYRVYRK